MIDFTTIGYLRSGTEKGEAFRQNIVELKKQGYKTEPAFGKLLGLTGNVYEALLNL